MASCRRIIVSWRGLCGNYAVRTSHTCTGRDVRSALVRYTVALPNNDVYETWVVTCYEASVCAACLSATNPWSRKRRARPPAAVHLSADVAYEVAHAGVPPHYDPHCCVPFFQPACLEWCNGPLEITA